MRKALTAATRLDLLLPWFNDPTDPYTASPADLTRWHARFTGAIGRFLVSFDGSPAAGYVEVVRRPKGWAPEGYYAPLGLDALPEKRHRYPKSGPTPKWKFDLDPDALQTLQVELGMVLAVGFGGPDVFGAGGGSTLPMPSLRFGVRNTHRPDVKLSTLTRRERQTYTAPGAYVLQVSGSTHDLVLYLVLHLLTAADMAGMLARCPAPAPRNWKQSCHHLFIRTGHGRKREYCTDACRVRANYAKPPNEPPPTPRGRKKR